MKILLNYFYMGAHATYEYLNIDRSMTEGMTYQYTEVICWLYGFLFSSNRPDNKVAKLRDQVVQ